MARLSLQPVCRAPETRKDPKEYRNDLPALGFFPQAPLAKRPFDLVLGPHVKNQDHFAFSPSSITELKPKPGNSSRRIFPSSMKKIDASDAVELAGGVLRCKLAGRFSEILPGKDPAYRVHASAVGASLGCPDAERDIHDVQLSFFCACNNRHVSVCGCNL